MSWYLANISTQPVVDKVWWQKKEHGGTCQVDLLKSMATVIKRPRELITRSLHRNYIARSILKVTNELIKIGLKFRQ